MSRVPVFPSHATSLSPASPRGAWLIRGAPLRGLRAGGLSGSDGGRDRPITGGLGGSWTSGDADQLLALYAEDAVYEEKPTNAVATGHEEIRALYEGPHATFSDIEVTPTTGFQTEGWATIEGTFAGKYTGQLPGLPAGAGQSFSVPFAAIFELEGDKIRRAPSISISPACWLRSERRQRARRRHPRPRPVVNGCPGSSSDLERVVE